MSLSSQIEAAFANVARPPEGELFEGDSEGAEDAFCGREWRDLYSSELVYHSFALHVLSPTGFAYFLPAFMLAALADEDSGLTDALIACLSPPKNDPLRPSFARRWSRLTQSQRRVVISFLRHFVARNPIAIESAARALEATNAG